jgi:hypothetical protein
MFDSDTTASTRSSLGRGEIAGVVVGSVVGLGLILAIIYLTRLRGRRSALGSKEETEREPEGGGDDGEDHDAAVAEEAKSVEQLPPAAEAIPAHNPKKHFAELPGDTATAELSDSRRIVELGDGRT